MRKALLLLILFVLVTPNLVFAQAGGLTQEEITRISNSVVLILNIQDDEVVSTGSGTVMTPTGQIYTNRHVVEDGEDFGILFVEDIGEQPVLHYMATPTLIHDELDLAILQIDRDANGRRVDPASLNLPFIDIAQAPPNIGDRIFVFGFPGIGDGFMVLTAGTITTIQNGNLNGDRIPLWYLTDAQISPGNSGGLAVNFEGRMVGIPTMVNAEERTLGRLGGIITATAVRSALDVTVAAIPTQVAPVATSAAPNVPPPDNPTTPGTEPQLVIEITDVEHDTEQDGAIGMLVHTQINAVGYRGVNLRSAVFLFWEDGSPMLAASRSAGANRTSDGQLTSQQILTPGFDDTIYDDAWFFIPYSLFPEGETGSRDAYVEAQIGVDGEGFTAYSGQSAFNYTFPSQQFVVDLLRIEHNVEIDNVAGMKVYGHVNVVGYRGKPIRVGLFLYWDNGDSISGEAAPDDYQTVDGALTAQDVVTPSFDNSEWEEFWFFVPYDYFPGGFSGVQDAYAQLEIGVDGEGFSNWSFTEPFQLNYN